MKIYPFIHFSKNSQISFGKKSRMSFVASMENAKHSLYINNDEKRGAHILRFREFHPPDSENFKIYYFFPENFKLLKNVCFYFKIFLSSFGGCLNF